MCFSASASFVAGGILTAAGLASIGMNRRKERALFSAIPLLFGIQQISEGFVWLALSGDGLHMGVGPPQLAFLLFAQVLWPLWAPFSIYRMEPDVRRRKWLRLTVWIGLLVSVFLLSGLLFFFHPVAVIGNHHIRYDFESWLFTAQFTGIAYFIPTVLPPFISGVRRCRLLGWLILTSFLVTKLFFDEFVISVWCYFAAIMSIVVIWVIREQSGPRYSAKQ